MNLQVISAVGEHLESYLVLVFYSVEATSHSLQTFL